MRTGAKFQKKKDDGPKRNGDKERRCGKNSRKGNRRKKEDEVIKSQVNK